ncbi:MAG TPA: hypothetical protein VJ906_09535 [Roseovarius sp.]|nr:hypothetical protein [Roseovarius sp.]
MSRFLIALPATIAAGPVLAHAGPHLHPHGIDALWLLVGGAVALGCGYILGRGRK